MNQFLSKHRLLTLLLVVIVSTIASCKSPTPEVRRGPVIAKPIVNDTPVYPDDLRDAHLYRIIPQSSMMHVLVYRGGTMANLGHNHVISSRTVNGYVWYHEHASLCGFDIALPVNDLIVDDNDARATEGADFPVNVPDSAKEGTRHNMLSENLLDGEHFSVIRLQSANIVHDSQTARVVVHVTIKNQFHIYTFPVSLLFDKNALHVSGEFSIKHTDFGIKPYSVALGALQVQDELKIKFHLIADAME